MDESGRGLEIKNVLYVGDAVFIAESREDLQLMPNEYERTCERVKLKIDADKIKLTVDRKDQTKNMETLMEWGKNRREI